MTLLEFSIANVLELRNKLTPLQKMVFEKVWKYFLVEGKPYPKRSIQPLLGKQSIKDVFKGLNGSLIYETHEQDGYAFSLTIYGAFLTTEGDAHVVLLIRLLELIKETYEKDSLIKTIDSNQVKGHLNLSDSEAQLLFKLLRALQSTVVNMPIYMSSYATNGSTWTATITDEVIELFLAETIAGYLNDRLSAGYRADEPLLYKERMRPSLDSLSIQMHLDGPKATQSMDQYDGSPYIDIFRINVIKSLSNSDFDFTRLVCLCEELNACASHGNYHAVIMLVRAILDHVPPLFGEYENFRQVASNYGGSGKSFKKSAERLENQARRVADRLLHMPIRNKEIAPSMHEVNFSSEVETVLSEICRIMK